MASSSIWGTVGWWTVVLTSIPFSVYAFIFIRGNFDEYKYLTADWNEGNFDEAGLYILHHLRAWQIHSLAAEVFILAGPFQFVPSIRSKYPTFHRWLGYTFVAAGSVCAAQANLFLIPHSAFRTFGRTVFFFQGLLLLYFLLVAVKSARDKKFKVHQKYMIRSAATGYAVIAVRIFPPILQLVIRVPFLIALEMASLVSPVVYLTCAETYIRTVLDQKPKPSASEGSKKLS